MLARILGSDLTEFNINEPFADAGMTLMSGGGASGALTERTLAFLRALDGNFGIL